MTADREAASEANAGDPAEFGAGKYAFDLSGAQWRISSHSSGSGSCVELAALPAGHVAVRDSTDRSRPALVFDAAEWRAFVAGIADGQFADLG